MDSFDAYQLATLRTWRYKPGSRDSILNAALGLAGEVGEYVEMVKKDFFHGIPIDHGKVLKEQGDILYYVSRALDDFHFNMSEAAGGNIEKLQKRYPEGFVIGGGIRE